MHVAQIVVIVVMVSLSIGRGEKRRKGGLTAKGRAKYNRATGSHLLPAAPHPKSRRDKMRRKSFCARSRKWTSDRGKEARRNWNCRK